MLYLMKHAPKIWGISCHSLKNAGLRSPQGFSLKLDLNRGNHAWWTTNEEAAYLFYLKYPKADQIVQKQFERKKQLKEYLYNLSFATESDIELRCPDGMDYRPYQRAGIEYCLNTKNTLIADEQRLGKTIIVLGLINNLKDLNKILIICPKTAKFGWKNECDKWLIEDYKVQVLDSKSEFDPTANIYIANYDILHIITDIVKSRFDLIVGDEIHLIKNQDARRSKFFAGIPATKKLGLSGTPLLNNPEDLLTVLKWLDPFWATFYIKGEKFTSKLGLTLSLEEVQDVVRSTLMLRRLQAQVFDAEPAQKRIITLPIDEETEPLVNAELHGLQDYAKVRRQLNIQKTRWALNHIDTYTSEGEKLVVFAYHREVIERLATSLGTKAVAIYGESSNKDRQDAVERFNNDPTCSVFIGSIPAASMALNLSVASHIVFVECDWSNGLMAQAEERCSDKNQKNQVLIEYLVYENSLDEKMLKRIDFKNETCDKAVDLIY